MDLQLRDRSYMMFAILLARDAQEAGERPFGCIIADPHGVIIAETSGSEAPDNPTRHSEVEAIQIACWKRKGLLHGCTIYSTHEPCLMCTGAIFHAKLSRVVWGSSRIDLPDLFRELPADRWRMTSTPPSIEVGVLREDCIQLFSKELADARG